MKNLITVLAAAVMAFGIANCGSKGGGGGGNPEVKKTNVLDGTSGIQFEDEDGNTITWKNGRNNIYTTSSKNGCVWGIAKSGDDKIVAERVRELEKLIQESTIAKGTRDKAHRDSRYLTIEYKSGKDRKFNLDNDLASKTEETLSKGKEILDFFYDLADEIEKADSLDCDNGKGDINTKD